MNDDELIEELRRSLGSSSREAHAPSEQQREPVADDAALQRRERAVSSAAMAIADQIMGLDAAIGSARPHLQLRSGVGATHPVGAELVIGRQNIDGALTIPDGRVSRSHATVKAAGAQLTVADLGSSNGTFLARGDEVTRVGAEPVPLRAGDRIETVDRLLLAEVIEETAS